MGAQSAYEPCTDVLCNVVDSLDAYTATRLPPTPLITGCNSVTPLKRDEASLRIKPLRLKTKNN